MKDFFIYRRDIDGLRAIAVLPVIFFHAGFEIFNGGFIGVDIFFIISGYLITSLILKDLESNSFSLLKFYERRIRRIVPLLFFVALICIPFAWLWMSPKQFIDFSQSIASLSIFSSNYLFWRESGYFDLSAETKPLLHTWSISIEEQYYLIFPILLIAISNLKKFKPAIFIIFLFIISFILSEYGWRKYPSANFYLIFSRSWELLIGSMCALYIKDKGYLNNTYLPFLGFLMIMFSIIIFDETTPTPSYYILIPIIGTIFIILNSNKNLIITKILSSNLFVGVGILSYSLYLWHQPILAFSRIYLFEQVSVLTKIIIISLTFIISVFSWKFIERPFRNLNLIIQKNIFIFFVLASSFLFIFGYIGHVKKGFPNKISKNNEISVKKILNENIWLIGDSHANHLVTGIKIITTGKIFNNTSNGCIPLRNVDRYDDRFLPYQCSNFINETLDNIIAKDPSGYILLSSMVPVYLEGKTFRNKDLKRIKGNEVKLISNLKLDNKWKIFEIGLENTFMELSKLKNTKTIFVIDVPELGISFGCKKKSKIIQTNFFQLKDNVENQVAKNCSVPRSVYDDRNKEYKRIVQKVSKKFPKIKIYDPTNSFCNTVKCNGYLNNYGYLYHDYDHLSHNGSKYWAINFAKWLIDN